MSKAITLSAAVDTFSDGSSLMLDGFTGIGPTHRLIGRLVRQRRRNRQPVAISPRFNRAVQMVQTYLAERPMDSDDPRTAELNEVIGNCVGWISDNRRGHGQASDARVPQEALRYALGYVEERSHSSASNEWVDGRPSG